MKHLDSLKILDIIQVMYLKNRTNKRIGTCLSAARQVLFSS